MLRKKKKSNKMKFSSVAKHSGLFLSSSIKSSVRMYMEQQQESRSLFVSLLCWQ